MFKIKYSQNFLHNKILINNLLKLSSINSEDTVLDIGAGKGIISEELSKIAKRVIAIELDSNLSRLLSDKFSQTNNVEIVNKDFFDYQLPKTNYKVFANIPFNRTSDLVRKLVFSRETPDDIYLVVQREAAEKFIGHPNENLFSTLLKVNFTGKILHNFNRTDFYPIPNADTVLLNLNKRNNPLIDHCEQKRFAKFVIFGYTNCTQNVYRSLRKVFTEKQIMTFRKDFGWGKVLTPSQTTAEQWVQMYNFSS